VSRLVQIWQAVMFQPIRWLVTNWNVLNDRCLCPVMDVFNPSIPTMVLTLVAAGTRNQSMPWGPRPLHGLTKICRALGWGLDRRIVPLSCNFGGKLSFLRTLRASDKVPLAVFSNFSQTRLVVVSAILPNQPDSEWDFHFDKIKKPKYWL
jgi:hypothetical protein